MRNVRVGSNARVDSGAVVFGLHLLALLIRMVLAEGKQDKDTLHQNSHSLVQPTNRLLCPKQVVNLKYLFHNYQSNVNV